MNLFASIGICLVPLLLFCVVFLLCVKKLSPLHLLFALLLGLIAIIPVTLVQYFLMKLPIFTAQNLLSVFVITFVFNGLIEESLKMTTEFFLPFKKMTLGSFVVCGILIGCAFGTFENIVYLVSGAKNISVRFFTSLILHSCCSGLSAIYVWSFKNKEPKIFCFILAVLLHGLYNFFAGSEKFWWFSIITIIYAAVRLKFSFDRIYQSTEKIEDSSQENQ